ncbi:uncharacterized protein TNCV_376471 [Trichonephila clavipes]|nr:uncharacterized protein TNCV_376471 [Trichonephila clavipes]
MSGRRISRQAVYNHSTKTGLYTRRPVWRAGRGSRVVKISDRGWFCHEFEPCTTKEPPCKGAMHVKSVENSNALPLVWCGS